MGSPRDLEALLGMDIRGGEKRLITKCLRRACRFLQETRAAFRSYESCLNLLLLCLVQLFGCFEMKVLYRY